MNKHNAGMVTHHGGCHCGQVRFEVQAPAEVTNLGLQLLGLLQVGISRFDCAERAIQATERRGVADHLYVQYRDRQAHLLHRMCTLKPKQN